MLVLEGIIEATALWKHTDKYNEDFLTHGTFRIHKLPFLKGEVIVDFMLNHYSCVLTHVVIINLAVFKKSCISRALGCGCKTK